MIIYKATNKTNNKIYIGQTIMTIKDRNRTRQYGKSKFDYAYRKYGEDGFNWEIIDTATSLEELNEKESYWIEKLNSTNPEIGYNLKGGGGNAFLTEEVKHKISEAQIGSKNHMFGKNYGQNGKSKKVINLETGIIYESGTQAKDKLNLKSEFGIYNSCQGQCSSYKGIRFRYLDENGNYIKTRFDVDDYVKKDIRVICLNDMNIFENSLKAVEYYQIDYKKSVIKKCNYNSKNLERLRLENRKELVFIYYRDFQKYLNIIENKPTYDINENRRKVAKEHCSKKIKCITDNLIFNSIKEASDHYLSKGYRGLTSSCIVNHLKKNTVFRYAKELKFEYI